MNSLNKQLFNDLKASMSLKNEFNKIKKESVMLSKEILKLKNSISEFHKGYETLDNLFISQKSYGDKFGLGYSNEATSSSSPLNKFVKAKHDYSIIPMSFLKLKLLYLRSLTHLKLVLSLLRLIL